MIEGLWSVEFISDSEVFGVGVVVLETQRILGGDAQYFYVGTYESSWDQFTATIEANYFAGQRFTIFGDGAEKFAIKVKGKPNRPSFDVVGNRVDMPELKIRFRLTWRSDLPG